MISHDEVEEIQGQAYVCAPAQFQNICLIYPLTVAEVMRMGYRKYNKNLGLLLLSEIEIQKLIKEKSGEEIPLDEIYPLQFLLQNASYNDSFFLELKEAFSTFLKEEVLLIPEIGAVLVNPAHPEEKKLINNENFNDFQTILKIQNRKEFSDAPPADETPAQRKMRLLREKVAAAKKRQAEKNKSKSSIVDLLEIATVYGIDLEKCSFYAFQGLIARYQAWEKYHIDIQMLCAGAEQEKLKIKYWGESSENK